MISTWHGPFAIRNAFLISGLYQVGPTGPRLKIKAPLLSQFRGFNLNLITKGR